MATPIILHSWAAALMGIIDMQMKSLFSLYLFFLFILALWASQLALRLSQLAPGTSQLLPKPFWLTLAGPTQYHHWALRVLCIIAGLSCNALISILQLTFCHEPLLLWITNTMHHQIFHAIESGLEGIRTHDLPAIKSRL